MKKENQLYMIGNAHIDPVWLWRWQEGFQEVKATFRSALDRMKEYEAFIFTSSSACFYAWVEENEPAMFEEIKKRVAQGRWVIVGGWWIQPDCNTPCGESYVRQGLYGQTYFASKFGKKAGTGYNVDSFGHNGMLPQILSKCGLKNYVFMRPGRHEKAIEGDTFLWQAPDGSQVTASRIPFEYCTWPDKLEKHIKRCAGEIKNPGNGLMCFYGVGNHGGGPTKKNIESILELSKNPELPELIFASPDDYFADVMKSERVLPVLSGELFHHASGCYSAHANIKQLNKRAENRLQAAEKCAVMADMLTDGSYDLTQLSDSWRDVLFNQFHDILTGCSLEAAFSDAKEQYGSSLNRAAKCLNHAIQTISWRIDIPFEEGMKPLVVVNPNAFAMTYEVAVEAYLPKEHTVLLDEHGSQIPYQFVQSQAAANGRCRMVFVAELPSLGWKTYRFCIRDKQKVFSEVSCGEDYAQNKWLRIQFDQETGYITSLRKKNDDTEYFSEAAAVPIVLADASDTWSHGVLRYDQYVGAFKGKVERIELGAVKAVYRVSSEYGNSRLIQDFSIYQELDFIMVKSQLYWHEQQKMLKIKFPMKMNYLRASYEIPYGSVSREPNGEEFPMQGFLDLEGANPGLDTDINGLSIVNDGCFSASVTGKIAALTVVRSPAFAHHEPYELEAGKEYRYMDQGYHCFTYALYPHDGCWEENKTVKLARMMSQEPIPLFETYHPGELSQGYSFLHNQAANVIVTVLKQAEDQSGELVLRAYETSGKHTKDVIFVPSLSMEMAIDFTPFEIKTLRFDSDGTWEQVNMLEERES
jgi:alpha-mannosidase